MTVNFESERCKLSSGTLSTLARNAHLNLTILLLNQNLTDGISLILNESNELNIIKIGNLLGSLKKTCPNYFEICQNIKNKLDKMYYPEETNDYISINNLRQINNLNPIDLLKHYKDKINQLFNGL